MEQYQADASNECLAARGFKAAFAREQAKAIERLPFTVKRVRNDEDMWKAVQVRHAAYARHIPAFAQSLSAPEESDYEAGAVVLLAESKLDGSPMGSTRIRNNFYAPLTVEASIVLPEWLQQRRLAEVTRLSVNEGRIGQTVKVALLKACVSYCQDNAIEWALATGRAPIDRQYERLLFVDLFADKAPVPLKHVGNIPHRVMAFEIDTIEQRWTKARHPMLNFFCHTHHPDIAIGDKPDLGPASAVRRSSGSVEHEVEEFELA
jgi:hypothetical protein